MYKIAKLALFSALFLLCSCDFIGDKTPSLDKAEAQFIAEAQIMSEQDALSKEISWYKAPQITERTLSRKLTGKDVIHEMNILLKENEEAKPDGVFGWTFKWNGEWIAKAKDYAVQHPYEVIAAEYYFTGVFTNYSAESKYSTIRKRLLYIYKPVDQWWDFYVSSN
jgi:hypothetical protein